MKSSIPNYFLVVAVLLTISACTNPSQKQQVLTEKIQYDVLLSNDDPQLEWWVNNIEGSRREPFLMRIMEAAANGEVRVYDYFNQQLSTQQIHSLGADTVYQTLLRNYPPYEEFDTIIVMQVTYRDINKIRFLEEWSWDPGKVEVSKKVIGLAPVIQREIAGETFNQLLFWIYLDDRYPHQ